MATKNANECSNRKALAERSQPAPFMHIRASRACLYTPHTYKASNIRIWVTVDAPMRWTHTAAQEQLLLKNETVGDAATGRNKQEACRHTELSKTAGVW